MRVVFMGTPRFAAVVLEALLGSGHEVVGCFTRPDAVRGRGKKLVPSPVKETALAANVPVYGFSSLRSDESYQALFDLAPDAVCVAAYGAILPPRVLELPRFGCLNVHGSLLPRWRGAAPVERAILAGDEFAGVGIMRMEEGLDTGAVCHERKVAIGDAGAEELTLKLAQAGGQALVAALDELEAKGTLPWREQPTEGIEYAEKVEKGELDIDPGMSALDALRHVRASSESHPCRCKVSGKGVCVQAASLAAQCPDHRLSAGEVGFWSKKLFLGFDDAQDCLELTLVKPDGKKSMDAKAFAAGIQGIKQGGVEWQEIHG